MAGQKVSDLATAVDRRIVPDQDDWTQFRLQQGGQEVQYMLAIHASVT